MKHYSIFALAAAGLLLSACSSDNNMENTTVENLNPTTKVSGYFKASINLPQNVVPASTRAWAESSSLDDGLENEYAVNSTLLLIFSGASEAEAKLIQVTSIKNPQDNVDDDPKQITVNSSQVIELTGEKEASTDNLYALAVCNGAGIIEKGAGSNSVVIGGKEVTGATLSDLQAVMTAQEGEMPFINGQGFFMTNAILSTVKGGAANPGEAPTLQILAPVNADLIYETEAEAEASEDAATDIYVERGVAKATITSTNLTVKDNVATTDGEKTTATFAGWCLDNTNLSSHIVRYVDPAFTPWNLTSNSTSVTTDPYRFIGGNAVDYYYGTENLYRTYWATDPNYDAKYDSTAFYEPMEKVYDDGSNPLYCFENTFDVAHQTYQNTTRAIVKLKLNGGETFYTIANDKKTLWSEDEIKNLMATSFINNSAVKAWFNNSGATGQTLTAEDLKFNFADDLAGYDSIVSVTVAGGKLTAAEDTTIMRDEAELGLGAAIIAANNTVSPIRRYVDGETFYSIRIKHFGDDLTPWNAGEYADGYKPAESSIESIYPGADASVINNNYLGRYGMVRNNWYDIALGQVMKIGSAVPPYINVNRNPDPDDPDPEDPEHPDDEVEQYLKVQINVLSWAKRTQTWDLK